MGIDCMGIGEIGKVKPIPGHHCFEVGYTK